MNVTYYEGGTPLTFEGEDDAYDYSRENKTCLEDANGREVYCHRWDH